MDTPEFHGGPSPSLSLPASIESEYCSFSQTLPEHPIIKQFAGGSSEQFWEREDYSEEAKEWLHQEFGSRAFDRKHGEIPLILAELHRERPEDRSISLAIRSLIGLPSLDSAPVAGAELPPLPKPLPYGASTSPRKPRAPNRAERKWQRRLQSILQPKALAAEKEQDLVGRLTKDPEGMKADIDAQLKLESARRKRIVRSKAEIAERTKWLHDEDTVRKRDEVIKLERKYGGATEKPARPLDTQMLADHVRRVYTDALLEHNQRQAVLTKQYLPQPPAKIGPLSPRQVKSLVQRVYTESNEHLAATHRRLAEENAPISSPRRKHM